MLMLLLLQGPEGLPKKKGKGFPAQARGARGRTAMQQGRQFISSRFSDSQRLVRQLVSILLLLLLLLLLPQYYYYSVLCVHAHDVVACSRRKEGHPACHSPLAWETNQKKTVEPWLSKIGGDETPSSSRRCCKSHLIFCTHEIAYADPGFDARW